MLPFLIQMPASTRTWLAKETLRRLDDRLDLTDAIIDGIPAIVAQNQHAAAGPGDPRPPIRGAGREGADNGPQPPASRRQRAGLRQQSGVGLSGMTCDNRRHAVHSASRNRSIYAPTGR
jgi:hypothetical protein